MMNEEFTPSWIYHCRASGVYNRTKAVMWNKDSSNCIAKWVTLPYITSIRKLQVIIYHRVLIAALIHQRRYERITTERLQRTQGRGSTSCMRRDDVPTPEAAGVYAAYTTSEIRKRMAKESVYTMQNN